jgi:hypothetical protein
VGVDGVDFLHESQGGSLNADAAVSYAINDLSLTTSGGVIIAAGDVPLTDSGGVSFGANTVSVELEGSKEYESGNITLGNVNIPSHKHDYSIWATYQTPQGGSGSGGNTIPDPGSASVGTRYSSGTLHADWLVTIQNNLLLISNPAPGTASFTVKGTFDVSKYTAPFVNPSFTYTAPTIDYKAPTVASQSYTATASGGATVSFSDRTEQPYVTCYMYKRTALEPLA